MADAYIDLLMRHMAWANQEVLGVVAGLPDSELLLVPPGCEDDWTVGRIATHIAGSAYAYSCRVTLQTPSVPYPEPAKSSADVRAAMALLAQADLVLREAASLPDEMLTFTLSDGTVRSRMRATILGQSIHHATEHRAQIADALTAHGKRVVDLDELDLWSFTEKFA